MVQSAMHAIVLNAAHSTGDSQREQETSIENEEKKEHYCNDLKPYITASEV